MEKLKKICAIILVVVMTFSVAPQNVFAAKKVKLNKTKATIYVGKTIQLKVLNNKKGVKWSTSNKKVATVTKKGKVKGIKAGKATITVRISKKKYKCVITVKKNPVAKPTKAPETTKPAEQPTTKPTEETTTENREDEGNDWVVESDVDKCWIREYRGKEKDVVIPEKIDGRTVVGILEYAFSSCSNITSIVLPNSVTSIGGNSFEGCDSLTNITIPNSVISIGEMAFYYCGSLESVTIPDSVISIGYSAFCGCSSLKSIVISNGLTSIEDYMFSDCSSLTNATIPNSVTSIGRLAFSGCSSLTNITIPESVTNIEENAFDGCYIKKDKFINNSNLEEKDNSFYGLRLCDDVQNDLYIINESIIYAEKNIIEARIPNGIVEIANGAFWDCSSLTKVIIPDGGISIGEHAFNECSSLTSITIPSSVTSIGESAFACDEPVESVIIKGKKGSYVEQWANKNGYRFMEQ